jgi:Rod binding domain-containing protein
MDHIIELRKRVALLEKQLENALVWVTAKQREEAVAREALKEMREALQQITELSPFKSNTGNDSMLYENLYSHQRRYITQMLVKITALAHEALKEKE